jgi:peptidoglycan hydrolase CwlO-like protein
LSAAVRSGKFFFPAAAQSPPAGLSQVPARHRSSSGGGALELRHQRRPWLRIATGGLVLALCTFCVTAAALATPSGTLSRDRERAGELASDVARLDAGIGAAVQRCARATDALASVRHAIHENERLQRLARRDLSLARSVLAARAVALYKHADATALDAVFSARDFGELVDQLTMVRRVAHSDRAAVRTIDKTSRELSDRALSLVADARTAKRLVAQRAAELGSIREQLIARRTLLSGVREEIRRLASKQARTTPSPGPSVEPPADPGGGAGQWWPLIQQAAAANGVSARGMYRLMMIESGGSATVVGPGGYYGLFQYAPSTWRGSWNPCRRSSITDGAAQIRATALALHSGCGHAWWDPSYSWAFEGR